MENLENLVFDLKEQNKVIDKLELYIDEIEDCIKRQQSETEKQELNELKKKVQDDVSYLKTSTHSVLFLKYALKILNEQDINRILSLVRSEKLINKIKKNDTLKCICDIDILKRNKFYQVKEIMIERNKVSLVSVSGEFDISYFRLC